VHARLGFGILREQVPRPRHRVGDGFVPGKKDGDDLVAQAAGDFGSEIRQTCNSGAFEHHAEQIVVVIL
jgi:hypothetical protein